MIIFLEKKTFMFAVKININPFVSKQALIRSLFEEIHFSTRIFLPQSFNDERRNPESAQNRLKGLSRGCTCTTESFFRPLFTYPSPYVVDLACPHYIFRIEQWLKNDHSKSFTNLTRTYQYGYRPISRLSLP